VVTETDLALSDGRTPHVYDTGTGAGIAGLAEGLNLTLRQVPCWIYGG
jgi:hypothetical protein